MGIHAAQPGEFVTFDPDSVGAPHTVTFPDGATNNDTIGIKALTARATNVVTVQVAAGTATIESPFVPSLTAGTIQILFPLTASVTWRYNSGRNEWNCYEGYQPLGGRFFPSYAAMGGVDRLGSLGVAWTPITYDADDFTPAGITTDPINGTLAFEYEGIYRFSNSFNLQHDSINSGREIELRLFNVTDVAGLTPIPIGIGRDQPATNYALSQLIEISPTAVGDLWRLEIGNGDTVVVSGSTVGWDVNHVGEWRVV